MWRRSFSLSSLRKQGPQRERNCAHRDAAALAWGNAVRQLSRNNAGRWLWVSAFAGTTTEISSDTPSRSRGAICPRLALISRPKKKRAQGKPGARCTRGLVRRMCKRMRTRAYRFSGGIPAFPARWFCGLFRALPGERAFLPPSPPEKLASQELDASVAASGPHDFAVRVSHARQAQPSRPPHPAPNVRDDREAPLLSRRDGVNLNCVGGVPQARAPAAE